MRRLSSRVLGFALLLAISAGAGAYYYRYVYIPPRPVLAAEVGGSDEAKADQYFTVKDEAGKEIFATGHNVSAGDEFISEDNVRYQVTEVTGSTAKAKSLAKWRPSWSFRRPSERKPRQPAIPR
jgi:hypothetical protein